MGSFHLTRLHDPLEILSVSELAGPQPHGLYVRKLLTLGGTACSSQAPTLWMELLGLNPGPATYLLGKLLNLPGLSFLICDRGQS